MNVRFHRNGQVSVDGIVVGTYRQPDPSGAAWARSPKWIFKSTDGRVHEFAAKRKWLEDYAIIAFHTTQKESLRC